MKATGIVRRIDDLGRIVIPKEIRRTLRIREGDPLEIFTGSQSEIILKKYSPIEELSQSAGQCAEALAQVTGELVCVTDRDRVVAAAGAGKKSYEEKEISQRLVGLIEDRRSMAVSAAEKEFIPILASGEAEYKAQAISTIICEGDAIGSVVLCSNEEKGKIGELERKLTLMAAGFLARQMEQ